MGTAIEHSLVYLRAAGYVAEALTASGAFAFANVLAVHPQQRQFLLVEAVPRRRLAGRLAQVVRLPGLAAFLKAGGYYELHGWGVGRWATRPGDAESLYRRPVGLGDLPTIAPFGRTVYPHEADDAAAEDDGD